MPRPALEVCCWTLLDWEGAIAAVIRAFPGWPTAVEILRQHVCIDCLPRCVQQTSAHLMTLTVMAPRLLASKAFLRAHISYSTHPMAHTSVLPSYALPCTNWLTPVSVNCSIWSICGRFCTQHLNLYQIVKFWL